MNYEQKPLVYIAGKLNSDACGYISNLKVMLDAGELVRKCGVSICVPGNDLLSGLTNGNLCYEDYIQNSMDLLTRCDAIFMCPNFLGSKGVVAEVKEAQKRDIPIFYDIEHLQEWLR